MNYKQFVPNQPLAPDTFWVLEQLPGTVMMADMSEILDTPSRFMLMKLDLSAGHLGLYKDFTFFFFVFQ